MTGQIRQESEALTPVERASRHLLQTLRLYNLVDLRDSPHAIMWDAREYAEMTSVEAVANVVEDKGLADASFGFGTRSFTESVRPELVINVLQNPQFIKHRHNVWDHTPDQVERSLIFFSQGVKYAGKILRARQQQARKF